MSGELIKVQNQLVQKSNNLIGHLNNLLPSQPEPELIPYRKGNKWGFCDRYKNIVIDCIYEEVKRFYEGYAEVQKVKGHGYSLINKKGRELYGKELDDAKIEDRLLYDSWWNGDESCYTYGLNEGLAIVYSEGDIISWGFSDRERINFGFVNTNLEILIPRIYQNAYSFTEGFAAVQMKKKWGFIDLNGKNIISFKYDQVKSFSQGFACVRIADKWGFINKNENFEISNKYDDVKSFSEDLAAAKLGDKWGFIDKQGHFSVQPNFEFVESFSENLAEVRLNGKWGFVNKSGKFIIPNIYVETKKFSCGVAQVKFNNYENWQIINSKNEIIVPAGKYDEVYPFENRIAKVRISKLEPRANFDSYDEYLNSGVYGYIDVNGTEYWEE